MMPPDYQQSCDAPLRTPGLGDMIAITPLIELYVNNLWAGGQVIIIEHFL